MFHDKFIGNANYGCTDSENGRTPDNPAKITKEESSLVPWLIYAQIWVEIVTLDRDRIRHEFSSQTKVHDF